MKKGDWVVVIVAICFVFIARGELAWNEDMDDAEDSTENDGAEMVINTLPNYNNSISPMGTVVDADGKPVYSTSPLLVVFHNVRVMQEMIGRHERMYQFLLDEFGCKPTSRQLGCFKE